MRWSGSSSQTARGFFGTSQLSAEQQSALRRIVTDFDESSIAELAATEATTKHDVKAVEYFVRARLAELGLSHIAELTHFACTSEDINNLSYALTVRDAIEQVWLPKFDSVVERIIGLAREHRDAAMLSRTHGQPATPTTMGKELAVFAHRLRRVREQIAATEFLGKFSGATGTFAAHVAALPNEDWPEISEAFVSGLGLSWNPLTTQIGVTRLAGRAVCTGVARQPHSAQSGHRHLDVHFARLFPANPGARRHGFVDHAAQDQPDPLRER